MKTAIAAVAILLFISVGCSKDQKVSRDLDGTWELQKINEDPVDEDGATTLKFEKDKDGKGTGSITYKDGATTIQQDFNYHVDGDELEYESEGDTDSWTIISLDNSVLKLNDDGVTTE
ncbi:unnamed protein product, partial [Chrysoparadoxa australica]